MQKIPPVALFFLLSFLMISIWFKDGLYYGGAEVGLSPYYNPGRYFNIQRFIWWTDVAPGVLVPQFISAVPLYFILSLLQNLFSPLFLQVVLFLVLLFLMGYGMYSFAYNVLGRDRKSYAIVAGIFYMLNSYVMVEVWHRFLYTGIFLAAAIPILALFWQKWIKSSKISFLLFFLFANLAFSYMYGNLTSAIAVWGLCSLITLNEIVFPWQGRKIFFKIGYRFIAGFLFFLMTNLWWLIPVIKVSTKVLPEQHSIEDNLGTLVNISKQTILPFILQYANPFYLFQTKELGEIYSSYIFLILPWVPAVVIFIGILIALRKKAFAAIAVSYFLAILITKGAANPFGYPYIWGFMKFLFIGIIRNPFEKLGILLPFFGSMLFVIGLENIFLISRRKYGNSAAKIVVLLIFLSVLLYAFPMFTGRVFNKPEYPLKIKVPLFYEQANEWFKSTGYQEGNILHLPFSGGDVGTYNWQNGYHGVEENQTLFTTMPSITRNISTKRINDTLNSLIYIFVPPYSEDKKQILRVLQIFNVKYIVLHKDINWEDKNTYGENIILFNPETIEKTLNNLDFLRKEKQFGDLVVYKLQDQKYRTTIYLPTNTQTIYPGQTDIMQIFALVDKNKDMISPATNNIASQNIQSTTVFPKKIIDYKEASKSGILADVNKILQIELPQLSNYFNAIGYLQSEKLTDDLIAATNKVIELYQQKLTMRVITAEQIAEYNLLITKIINGYNQNLSAYLLFEKYVGNYLKLHLFILKELSFNETAKALEEFLIKAEILPIYQANTEQKNSNRLVYKFKVPQAGLYKLISPTKLQNNSLIVNGKRATSIDALPLQIGDYEISINAFDEQDKKGVALRLDSDIESSASGQILTIKKDNPVQYSGKLHIDKPLFIMFSQSYNPGWALSLSQNGKSITIDQHFIGNLYSNAWWIESLGDFDFKIEFTPQQNVKIGLLLSILAWFGILIMTGMSKYKEKHG